MTSNEERVRKLITEEASNWFVANRAGLSAEERDAFVSWLRISPTNVEEYLAVSVVAVDLLKARADEADTIDDVVGRAHLEDEGSIESLYTDPGARLKRIGRYRWPAMAATAAAAVIGIALAWWVSGRFEGIYLASKDTAALHYATGHGERHTYQLADKSILHLNTETAVTVQFSGKERRVTLNAGEAEFEVAHETMRAFRVSAGPAEIVSIGTQFDVRMAENATAITVLEGRIAVGRSISDGRVGAESGPPRFVDVVANQQLVVAAGEDLGEPINVDAQRTTAWLHRQITFDHEPLEQVANEFNRFAEKPFRITTPALKKLAISGVFTTDDTAAFIAFLRSLDGVHVEEGTTQIRVFKDETRREAH